LDLMQGSLIRTFQCSHRKVLVATMTIPRSSVRFRLKPDTSNSHEFELHRPSNKGTKLLLKVIKAIIIMTMAVQASSSTASVCQRLRLRAVWTSFLILILVLQ
jgi:hypothetical protein